MITLAREDIIAVCPPPKFSAARAIWDGYVDALTSSRAAELFEEYEITTPARMVPVLATMACESNLSLIWESGAYDADGIVRVFGPGKHSAAIGWDEARKIAALPLERRTAVLFERAYGSGNPAKARKLGNTRPGDGAECRGLGLNQMTGREAHEKAAAIIGCSLTDLQEPINLVHAFLIEWDRKNCNHYADLNDWVSIRKLINGGSLDVPVRKLNGLPQMMAAARRAQGVITGDDFAADAPVVAMAGSLNKPVTLLASTEMQASGLTTLGGSNVTANAIANAVTKGAASGSFKLLPFLIALASEPEFWVGAGLIATGVYLGLKRFKRFHIWGV
jgi:predicted chitinase